MVWGIFVDELRLGSCSRWVVVRVYIIVFICRIFRVSEIWALVFIWSYMFIRKVLCSSTVVCFVGETRIRVRLYRSDISVAVFRFRGF